MKKKFMKFYATDENVGGENAGNTSVENTSDTNTNSVGTQSTATETKLFTQEQVNEMIRERLARQEKSFAEKSDKQKNTLDELASQTASLRQELAFVNNNIDQDKKDDILALFKGKGLEFTEENLKELLPKHPEWLKKSENIATISNLGKDHETKNKEIDKKEIAKKMFGLDGFIA